MSSDKTSSINDLFEPGSWGAICFRDPIMPSVARVASYLAFASSRSGGGWFAATYQEVCDATGLPLKSVSRGVSALVKAGRAERKQVSPTKWLTRLIPLTYFCEVTLCWDGRALLVEKSCGTICPCGDRSGAVELGQNTGAALFDLETEMVRGCVFGKMPICGLVMSCGLEPGTPSHRRYLMNTDERSWSQAGWVYAIQAEGSGLIKIGYSRDPFARIKTLQASNGEALRLMNYWPGGKDDEFRAHAALADHRERGEWFRAEPDVIAFAIAEELS